MQTQEQDVVKAKAQIAGFKQLFLDSISGYLLIPSDDKPGQQKAILDCQQKGSAYFNYAEEFVGNSDLLGAHKNALWAQGFAEDCAEMLKSMPGFYDLLSTAFANLPALKSMNPKPGSTAYANMQRMVVRYLEASEVRSLKELFAGAGLPIYGFSNEAREFMSRKLQIWLSFIFGVVFICVLIAIALFKPDPSDFQYTIFRTVLALAGAGVAAVIPGFIQANVGTWIRAGGALAVFVIIYFWIPALQPSSAGTSPKASQVVKP